MKVTTTITFTNIMICLLLLSCVKQPRAIKPGIDQCDYCKMIIEDARFPCELLTKKGKTFVFDDIHCILGFLKENASVKQNIQEIYLTDYTGNHSLINANHAFLLKSAALHSPMNGNIAAFTAEDSLHIIQERLQGERLEWNSLLNK